MADLHYGELEVDVALSNAELGSRAAEAFARALEDGLEDRAEVSVVLAAANSQLTFVESVVRRDDIDWSRINVLHMDEYVGVSADHPASFRRWIREKIVERVRPKAFFGIEADHDPVDEEVARYTRLVRELEPVVCVMGIGENGHLAFNDPPAEFETPDLVHMVSLDDASRRQQVGEGHFPSMQSVPSHAVTLTIPALLRCATVLVVVPERRKAKAVKEALDGPVTVDCPASVLTTQRNARLFLDTDSAGLL